MVGAVKAIRRTYRIDMEEVEVTTQSQEVCWFSNPDEVDSCSKLSQVAVREKTTIFSNCGCYITSANIFVMEFPKIMFAGLP